MGKEVLLKECSTHVVEGEIDLLIKNKEKLGDHVMAGFLTDNGVCCSNVLKDGARQVTKKGIESHICYCSLLEANIQ